ncbi:hypothetical protein BVRB_2g030990 [Beta vulgaris subsp. vulgaris]|nr:hypothetical protein BVRB_2g030990 [Beta vulgaris subsp. vulgaris]
MTEETQKIDPSHTLFLHHGDHPSYVLSPEPLDGSNYNQRKRACIISLKAKNKLGLVARKCPKPNSSSPNLNQWERCDNMVISWLIHSMTKDIASSILYCESSAEIWSELEVLYAHVSGTKIYKIQKDITNFSQNNLSITNYFTKLKYLHDEYMEAIDLPTYTCGSAQAFSQLIQDQHLMHFLMGLNEPYNTTRGNLLMKSPLPTVNQAYHALLEEERQREITGTSTIDPEASAMASFNRKYQPNFTNKTQPNDYQRNQQTITNFRGNVVKKNNYYCDYCKCPGHSTERCYKLNGYPPNHKFNNNHNGQNNGKGKKIVAYSHGNTSRGEDNEGDISSNQCLINQDQCNHLMDMIKRQTLDSNGAATNPDTTPTAMLAEL